MAIIEKEGFKFHDGLSSDYIVVEDKKIDDYVDYINGKELSCLAINVGYYKKNDISFLENCPNIEKLSLNSPNISDFSGIYSLNKLNALDSDEPAGILDLSLLVTLRELSIGWNKNVKQLDNCLSLRKLRLRGYKPKSKDLSEITNLKSLEELSLTQPLITSLRGCSSVPKLQKLELNNVSSLELIDEIEKNSTSLKSLRFDSCKKIKNFEYVSNLKELEVLGLNNCGDIPTIQFIKGLPKLKNLTFVNTNIVDGDISPCIGLDYVSFSDKKHYSHKRSDIIKTSEYRV